MGIYSGKRTGKGEGGLLPMEMSERMKTFLLMDYLKVILSWFDWISVSEGDQNRVDNLFIGLTTVLLHSLKLKMSTSGFVFIAIDILFTDMGGANQLFTAMGVVYAIL